jgi:hypothetical protein
MVRSSTQHNKSGQSSLESSEINISERQKKTSIKGTVGEYEAIAKLTKEGYFVAKAVDPSCPFDIVLVDKNGKIQLIDIKTKPTDNIKKVKV